MITALNVLLGSVSMNLLELKRYILKVMRTVLDSSFGETRMKRGIHITCKLIYHVKLLFSRVHMLFFALGLKMRYEKT